MDRIQGAGQLTRSMQNLVVLTRGGPPPSVLGQAGELATEHVERAVARRESRGLPRAGPGRGGLVRAAGDLGPGRASAVLVFKALFDPSHSTGNEVF